MSRRSKALVVTIALCLGPVDARAESEPLRGPCRTEGVIDGITAELRCADGLVRVRLIHLASPRPGEAGYTEAARALRALLAPRELWLGIARSDSPRHAAESPLGVVLYDRAGQNLNVVLVSLGWARYAGTEGDDPLEANFAIAEREARSEQRAMWSVWAYTVGRGEPRAASER